MLWFLQLFSHHLQVVQVFGWQDNSVSEWNEPVHSTAIVSGHRTLPPAAGLRACSFTPQPPQPWYTLFSWCAHTLVKGLVHASHERHAPAGLQRGHTLFNTRLHLRGESKQIAYTARTNQQKSRYWIKIDCSDQLAIPVQIEVFRYLYCNCVYIFFQIQLSVSIDYYAPNWAQIESDIFLVRVPIYACSAINQGTRYLSSR